MAKVLTNHKSNNSFQNSFKIWYNNWKLYHVQAGYSRAILKFVRLDLSLLPLA